MPEEEKKDAAPKADEVTASPAAAAKGGKGGFKLLAAIVVLIAAGAGIAVMAIPSKDPGVQAFHGPWSFKFFEERLSTNTLDDNFSRFFQFDPSCNYFAYEESYVPSRMADPDFLPALKEAMTNVVARFTLGKIMVDNSSDEFALVAQLEHAVEPIVFPVHVGDSILPLSADPKSGLRPGDSLDRRGTFRGAFFENHLMVDAAAKTVRLGEGVEVTFAGGETDLEVRGSDGSRLYLDVTALKPGFEGKVRVGVKGRIRQIYLGQKLAN